jgi:hypothetical protein
VVVEPLEALHTLHLEPATGMLTASGGGVSIEAGSPLDIDVTGEWILNREQPVDTNLTMLRLSASGELTVHSEHNNPLTQSGEFVHLRPNLDSAVTVGPSMYRYPLNPDMTFTGAVHWYGLGLVSAQASDITPDGEFIIVNYQDGSQPGYPFVLGTFGFADDGGFTGPHDVYPYNIIADRIVFFPPRTLPTLLGDANVDGVVDAADVVFVINEAIPDDKPILLPQNFANADLDQDIDVDPDDLEALIQLLLTGELPQP